MKRTIYGLIGYPVKHSLSGVMHNTAFKALGINAEYRLFEIEPGNLEDFLLNPAYKLKDIRGDIFYAKDVAGFNITIPHKIRAREILSKDNSFSNNNPYYVELSGAINTVKRNGSGGSYWNTDSYGFESALENTLKFKPQNNDNALVIGCGGVGRIIISVLSRKDIEMNKIYIYDKSKDAEIDAENHFFRCFLKYPHIKGKLEFITEDRIAEVISQCRLLVNASPSGMGASDECPIPEGLLHKDLFVYDVVYNRETRLVRRARIKCAASAGGLSMLLYQGAYAFSLWVNKPAPVTVMKDALDRKIHKRVDGIR